MKAIYLLLPGTLVGLVGLFSDPVLMAIGIYLNIMVIGLAVAVLLLSKMVDAMPEDEKNQMNLAKKIMAEDKAVLSSLADKFEGLSEERKQIIAERAAILAASYEEGL